MIFRCCLATALTAEATLDESTPTRKSTPSSRMYLRTLSTATVGMPSCATNTSSLRPRIPPRSLISFSAIIAPWDPCLPYSAPEPAIWNRVPILMEGLSWAQPKPGRKASAQSRAHGKSQRMHRLTLTSSSIKWHTPDGSPLHKRAKASILSSHFGPRPSRHGFIQIIEAHDERVFRGPGIVSASPSHDGETEASIKGLGCQVRRPNLKNSDLRPDASGLTTGREEERLAHPLASHAGVNGDIVDVKSPRHDRSAEVAPKLILTGPRHQRHSNAGGHLVLEHLSGPRFGKRGCLDAENLVEILRLHLFDPERPAGHPHSLSRRFSSASEGRMYRGTNSSTWSLSPRSSRRRPRSATAAGDAPRKAGGGIASPPSASRKKAP